MERWYYSDAGQQRGPVSGDDLKSMLETGKIQPETLVWSEGMPDWKPAGPLFPVTLSPYTPPAFDATASGVDLSGDGPTGAQLRPWLRWWARTFDTLLFALFFGGIVAAIWPAFGDLPDTVFGIVVLFAYNFFEALLLCVIGTTPFKALLRIKVRRNDGTKPSYFQALRRTLGVWFRGQGLGIGIVAIFTGIHSYKRLMQDGITSWDQDGEFTVSHRQVAWWRWLLLAVIFFGFVALIVLGNEM